MVQLLPAHTAAQCKTGVESRSSWRQCSPSHCIQEISPRAPNPLYVYHLGSVSSLLVPLQAHAALALSELSQELKWASVMLLCWGLSGLCTPFPFVPCLQPHGDTGTTPSSSSSLQLCRSGVHI